MSIVRNWGQWSHSDNPPHTNNSVLKLVTPPADEPVALTEAKRHLRVDFPDDDPTIQLLISACRGQLESWLRRSLLNQTWDLTLDWGPAWVELPRPPLVSVTEVKVRGLDTTEVLADPASYYVNASANTIALKPASVWPVHITPMGWRVRFVAGYGDTPDDVPAAIRMELLAMVSQQYEDRSSIGVSEQAKARLSSFRVVGAGIRMAKGVEPPELLA